MPEYHYGVPMVGPPQAADARPRCWALGHDLMSRDCRGCGYQTSCKDECDRRRIQQMPFQQPHPQPVPVPVPVAYHQPQPGYPQAANRALAPAARSIQQLASQGSYGWYQDPLYWNMAAVPPPVRIQLEGEGFFERVAKNAVLAAGEAVLGQCFLAIRQALWNPPVVEVQASPPPQMPPQQP